MVPVSPAEETSVALEKKVVESWAPDLESILLAHSRPYCHPPKSRHPEVKLPRFS